MRIVAISHDASRTGAPRVLLTLLEWLVGTGRFDVHVGLVRGGPLEPEFRHLVDDVRVLADGKDRISARLMRRVLPSQVNRRNGFALEQFGAHDVALVNTATALGQLAPTREAPIVAFVHELLQGLRERLSEEALARLPTHAEHFIAASAAVRADLLALGVAPDKASVIHEFLPSATAASPVDVELARAKMAPDGGRIVLGCGTADWRKGPDLFLQAAYLVRCAHPHLDLRWVWLGGGSTSVEDARLLHDVYRYGLADVFTLVPPVEDVAPYMTAASAFVLSSRDDPYPVVVLEAASQAIPVVCFGGAGGAPDFVGRGAGVVVPYGDSGALASAVAELVMDQERSRGLGDAGRLLVQQEHVVTSTGPQIEAILRQVSREWNGQSRHAAEGDRTK